MKIVYPISNDPYHYCDLTVYFNKKKGGEISGINSAFFSYKTKNYINNTDYRGVACLSDAQIRELAIACKDVMDKLPKSEEG